MRRQASATGLFLLALAGCSKGDGLAPDCASSCSGQDSVLRVGALDGDRVATPLAPRRMVYGPQGGQHFFVDAELQTPLAGRVRLDFEFTDPRTGETLGRGRWQEELDGCGTLIEHIPIVTVTDERRQGDLEVTATIGDCSWKVTLRDVVALPPVEQRPDAGAEDASTLALDEGSSDGGG
jgi:hypothetical protein